MQQMKGDQISGLLRQDGNSHGTDEVLAILLKYGISAKEQLLEITEVNPVLHQHAGGINTPVALNEKAPCWILKKPIRVRENAAVINGGCQGKTCMQDVKIHVFPANFNCYPVQVDAAHYYLLRFWSDIMFKKNNKKNKQNVSVLLYSNVTVRSQSARSFGMFFFFFFGSSSSSSSVCPPGLASASLRS